MHGSIGSFSCFSKHRQNESKDAPMKSIHFLPTHLEIANPLRDTLHLLLWNQTRQQWVGNKKVDNRQQELVEPKLRWNATYESLLRSNKRFAQRLPLAEMVDFLVDIWEQDGKYD
ncbi:hypothetical protein MLD38_029417 [Melastoma candidum]|uniref:Uncharacterized protein n=1 Tax=Melastoma candidum TaxID=119954 RepID=A0ACB9N5J2_9MYRT|nr:hypothetical protein MLD38_029417 [Melastoma candidum]